jgi:hypothetical protein
MQYLKQLNQMINLIKQRNGKIWPEPKRWNVGYQQRHDLNHKNLHKIINAQGKIDTNSVMAYLDLCVHTNGSDFYIFGPQEGLTCDSNNEKHNITDNKPNLRVEINYDGQERNMVVRGQNPFNLEVFKRHILRTNKKFEIVNKKWLIFTHYTHHCDGHYNAVVINMSNRRMILLDSLPSQNKAIGEELEDFAYCIRNALGCFSKPMSGPMSRELVYLENLPKQKDATSCGIFMLEYIRKMIDTGGIPDEWSFAQEDIPGIRKRIAVELFQQDLMELN